MKAIYLRRTFGKVDVEHFSFSISWMFWLAGWSKVDLLSAWKQMRLGALPCWYFLDRRKSAFFSFSPDLQHHTVLANPKDIATGAVVMRDWYCRTTRGTFRIIGPRSYVVTIKYMIKDLFLHPDNDCEKSSCWSLCKTCLWEICLNLYLWKYSDRKCASSTTPKAQKQLQNEWMTISKLELNV